MGPSPFTDDEFVAFQELASMASSILLCPTQDFWDHTVREFSESFQRCYRMVYRHSRIVRIVVGVLVTI